MDAISFDDAAAACSGCGLSLPGATAGCQGLFEELSGRANTHVAYGRAHRMAVDAYCLPHPDRYFASKSLAAHLGGLCWAFEHRAHPAVGRALLRWLDGPRRVQKPSLPSFRGARTIAEVLGVPPEHHPDAVERWARAIWEAYEPLHDAARGWIRTALDRR